MMRHRFLKDVDAIARGEDPKATIRDPEVNRCVGCPLPTAKALIEGYTREELAKHPLGRRQLQITCFKSGQPARRARSLRRGHGHRKVNAPSDSPSFPATARFGNGG